jgi:hypothetical protein
MVLVNGRTILVHFTVLAPLSCWKPNAILTQICRVAGIFKRVSAEFKDRIKESR